MGDYPTDAGRGGAWYEEAFRSDYRRVYAHRNFDAALEEVKLLETCGVGGTVLDLCCGFGRHTLALRRRGLSVFGLDLSFELLRDSASLPQPALLRGRLFQADATRLPLRDASLDSVVNLFSSFGYFGEAGDARMLDEIARVLRPGGVAVFDLMNPQRVRERLVSESSRAGEGFRLSETRSLEDSGRRVVKEVVFEPADGPPRRWREDVRLYELGEMRELLAARGVTLGAVYGAFDGRPFERGEGGDGGGADSERMILCGRRAGSGSR